MFLNGFILAFVQIEIFLYLAHLIFKKDYYGSSPGEITKILLSRFALFFIVCFVAALIVMIIFLYIKQLLRGEGLSNVIFNFLTYEFRGWFKSTIFGLSLGAVIYIIVLWQDALKNEQKMREENLIFQNETLKTQVNPHFLFNSLNTISSLIQTQPATAEKFINNLSSVYRYILENVQKDRISLQSELDFINGYFNLHKVRDEEKIMLNIDIPLAGKFEILPVSLQILVENAIKHNVATRENPLIINIFTEYTDSHYIVVKNNLQRKASQLNSMKIGIKNLRERVKLITGRVLIVEERNSDFIVKMPLII
jgi:sensor histidine kinase YesM